MSSSTSARAAGSSSTEHRYSWRWRLADLAPPAPGAPTVLTTFSCGGGSSMGYRRAGFRVVGNVEIDPRIAAVYRANLHPTHEYVMDIREFNRIPVEELPRELLDLDVLDGSPPCSVFSTAGNRERDWGKAKAFAEGQAVQTLDDLFFEFLAAVGRLRPRAFIAENVTGILIGNARAYAREIVRQARSLGYAVQVFELDASAMGVPQRRRRVFFIGNRCGFDPLRLSFDEDPIVFGDVRTETSGHEPTAYMKALWRAATVADRNIENVYRKRFGMSKGFKTDRIISDREVARTLTTAGYYLRGCDGFPLSTGDCRAISTFPDDYDFGNADPRFICGMSVPPSMMANVAHEVREQWLS